MARIYRLRAFEGCLCAFGLVRISLALVLALTGLGVVLSHCKRVVLLFSPLDDVGCAASGCKAESDVSLRSRFISNSNLDL